MFENLLITWYLDPTFFPALLAGVPLGTLVMRAISVCFFVGYVVKFIPEAAAKGSPYQWKAQKLWIED